MNSHKSNYPPAYQTSGQPLNQTKIWGAYPCSYHCPHCNSQITTKVKSKATPKTHLWALFCCLLGCCFCAPCVYCMESLTVQEHYCPNCNNFLGVHEKD